jgi:hypothetical protein
MVPYSITDRELRGSSHTPPGLRKPFLSSWALFARRLERAEIANTRVAVRS